MLTIRPIEDKDYELLCGFWSDWGWVAPTKDFLPDCGMIVYNDEVPIIGGYLYATNSKVAWVEWIISNKNYTNRENRKIAINLLVQTLTNIAQKSGFKYVYTILKHEGLIKAYESVGYIKGSTGIEMIKTL